MHNTPIDLNNEQHIRDIRLYENNNPIDEDHYIKMISGNTLMIQFFAGKEELIAKGSSKTFELRAHPQPKHSNDYLSIRILSDGAYMHGTLTSIQSSFFIWGDTTQNNTKITAPIWANGFRVLGLDVGSSTMRYDD